MAKRQSTLPLWWDKFVSFNVESLFARKRGPAIPRTVFFNQNVPEHFFDHKGRPKKENVYSTNQVITSKYTVITFLPRNLLEQFRRIANMYVTPAQPYILCSAQSHLVSQLFSLHSYPPVLPRVFHHLTRSCSHTYPHRALHHCYQGRL
jgi:hypothetical protein